MNTTTETPMHAPVGPPADASLKRDLLTLIVLGALGAIAANLNVSIPFTEIYIEVRWAFGYMGFAILRRTWAAVALAGLLSVSLIGAPMPTTTAFLGNMVYALPALATIRLAQFHILSRCRSLFLYGAGWFLLMLFCYQAFNTPITWALVGILKNEPIRPFVISGWKTQPYLIESLLAAIISTSGMLVLRSHEALRRSRNELAVTLDAIGDGVIVTDGQGRVIRINPVAQDLTGWSLAEAWKTPLEQIFRIVNARTGEPAENPARRVMEDGVIVGLANHTTLIARDGTRRQIADSAAPVKDDNGRIIGVVMVFRDVTAEYEAGESLKRANDMINRSPAVAFVWKNAEGWPVTFASRNAERIFGWTADDFLTGAVHYADVVHPDDLPRVREEVSRFGADPAASKVEHAPYRIRTRNGAVKWLEDRTIIRRADDGAVTDYEGVLLDITDRMAAEAQFRFQSRILEQIQDLVTVTDLDGNITYINDAECRLLGASRDEIIGRHVSRFGEDPSAGASQAEIIRETLEKGHWRGEVTNYRADGEAVILDCRTHLVKDADGKPIALCGISTDMTEKIALQKAREKAEEQYRQTQKIESIGRLAGGVAHDLNNLLSPILGYGEMLLEDFDAHDARKASVEEIVQAGLRARDLVRQLLAFSRKQVLEFKLLDLNNVLARFEKLLRRTIREDIDLKIFPAPSLPLIQGDIGQLEQVIMNLAVNAQDAMPDGGALTMETAVAELDEEYAEARSGVTPGRYVMLSVSDTGLGVDDETRERIFEPFFTTKEKDKGTGLGLATVYGIVKQHGGNIWIYSEPGKGATFKVYLPAAEETDAPSERPPAEASVSGRAETILLVEDNVQVRHLTRAILLRQGYIVLTAESGKHALAVCDQLDGEVDLLLTDVVMPEMSGRELYDRIAARHPHVKALYMSGYTDNVIAHRGVLDKGVHFIQKPFSAKVLAAKVREALTG